jgi:CBS domain-containing protein
MQVQHLMTRAVATAHPSDSLAVAARLMRERECGCVAVVDDERRVTGILTDRDVCMAALDADQPLSRLEVGVAMSTRVHVCRPEDSIGAAEQLMGQHQVRRLPVVDEERHVQGVLSLDDLAREARAEEDLIVAPVSSAGVGRTLGQIGRPHLIEELDA